MTTPVRLTIALAICTTHASFAQEAWSYPDALPTEGLYTFARRSSTLPFVDYNAGAPWDFTSLSYSAPTLTETAWTPSAGTPFAAMEPLATHCLYAPQEVAEYTLYQYFNSTPTVLQLFGEGTPASGYDECTDPWDAYLFPSQVAVGYQDYYTISGSTYQVNTNPLSKGTFTTPYGNYADVVLVEFAINDGNQTEFSYAWFSASNMLMPLAVYDMDSEEFVLYTPENLSPLSIPSSAPSTMRLAPNPCAGNQVRLFNSGEVLQGQLTATAVDGRVVLDHSWSSGGEHGSLIDVSGLTAGNYVLRLVGTDGVRWQEKLVVTR